MGELQDLAKDLRKMSKHEIDWSGDWRPPFDPTPVFEIGA